MTINWYLLVTLYLSEDVEELIFKQVCTLFLINYSIFFANFFRQFFSFTKTGSSLELYDSIHNRLFTLPDDYSVFPGHDYKGTPFDQTYF